MACFFLSRRFLSRWHGWPQRAGLGLALGALLMLTASLTLPAQAQIRGYYSADPNVSVDLSVLGGPGNEPIVTTPLPPFGASSPGTSPPAAPGASPFSAPVAEPFAPSGAEPFSESGAVIVQRTTSRLQFPPQTSPRSRLVGRYSEPAAPQLRRPEPRSAPSSPSAPPQSRLIAPAPAAPPPPSAAGAAPIGTTPKPRPILTPPPMPAAPSARPVPAPQRPPVQTAARPTVTPRAMSTPAAPAAAAVPKPPSLPKPTAIADPTPPPAMAVPKTPAPAPSTQTASVETATRTAAATPGALADPDNQVRILFDGGSAKLPDSARAPLETLVSMLNANDALRVQLEAYAEGTNDNASQARRLSLSRALAVRSHLIDKGVRSTRMDVRALGNKPSDPPAPADRVDALLVER